MPGWMSWSEALAYFGLGDDEAELERIVLEHGIEAEVDEEGRLVELDIEQAKAALFAEHHRKVGYRPDDESARAELERRERGEAARAKRRRAERRQRLEARVGRRKAGGR